MSQTDQIAAPQADAPIRGSGAEPAGTNWRSILVIVALIAIAVGLAAYFMRWDWLDPNYTTTNSGKPEYLWEFVLGLYRTLLLLVLSVSIGYALAVPIGLVQVTGPWPLKWLATGFCTFIRGTPLLVQLWLLYFGFGSLFPQIPGIRSTFIWPFLREGFYYALVAFILSFAGYEGEVMRGGFLSVPKGELEAARAFGMSFPTMVRRIWLPRALLLVLPTLSGEVVSQLKSTPLAATVTVFDIYGVGRRVQQDLFLTYEPLLLIAAIYGTLTLIIATLFKIAERRVPMKRG
jgi:polar amino acid transport system permease protein